MNYLRNEHAVNLCEDLGLHYDATTSAGDATVYDGALLHKGLANTAEVVRPVLVLSFTKTPEDALVESHGRDYAGHAAQAEGLPAVAEEAGKYVQAFMAARAGHSDTGAVGVP